MKKSHIILVLLLLGLSTEGNAQQVTKLTPDLTAVGGRWEVDKKGIMSGFGFVRYDSDLPDAFLFKASIRMIEAGKGAEGGTRFEICFRRNPNEEWPTYLFRIRFDGIALIKWDEGRKTLDELKIDIPQEKWIKLQLRMKGSKIEARVGKKFRLKAVDPKPIDHGKFLIGAIGLKVDMKDVKITELK